MDLSRILLWLWVINLGIAFGAGLYESRIVFANWLTSSDSGLHWDGAAAQRDNVGLRFWVFVSTVPLTLLTLANLIAAWRADGTLRMWWMTAVLAALAERAFTFSYFIPTMIGLMQSADSTRSVAVARRWGRMNYMRHVLAAIAWIAALNAFALLYKQSGR